MTGRILVAVAMGVLLAVTAFGKDIYVDAANGADLNDGLDWTTPKQTLSGALLIAEPNDTLHLAKGNYDNTDIIIEGLALLGGYPPLGAGDRNTTANPTKIRSVYVGDGYDRTFDIKAPRVVVDGFYFDGDGAFPVVNPEGGGAKILNNYWFVEGLWSEYPVPVVSAVKILADNCTVEKNIIQKWAPRLLSNVAHGLECNRPLTGDDWCNMSPTDQHQLGNPAYGVLVSGGARNVSITNNAIRNIYGGRPTTLYNDIGNDQGNMSLCEEPYAGENGGNAFGIFAESGIDIFVFNNNIEHVYGGKGGGFLLNCDGEACDYCNSVATVRGGNGGLALGIQIGPNAEAVIGNGHTISNLSYGAQGYACGCGILTHGDPGFADNIYADLSGPTGRTRPVRYSPELNLYYGWKLRYAPASNIVNEIVYGNLDNVYGTMNSVELGLLDCLAGADASGTVEVPVLPPVGETWFYLIRDTVTPAEDYGKSLDGLPRTTSQTVNCP